MALLTKQVGARLIHLSTDCIFSGKKGNYLESDPSDAGDLYGKTKFLGEVKDDFCLTLRTSIIGPELSRKKSLLEWFLAQEGTIKGFRKAIYSGFTTLEMSRIIELMFLHPKAYGVYQVSSEPINKYDLCLFRVFGRPKLGGLGPIWGRFGCNFGTLRHMCGAFLSIFRFFCFK